jgi:phage replication-related protein YjqB (UPF0714/DUF867 family)
MADRYDDVKALKKAQTQGVDFRIRSFDRGSKVLIMAPHGGGIEPGTSEIAEAVAGADLSFYAFEGIKQAGNRQLHITSTRFNEPTCLALVSRAERVIAIHGEDSADEVVYLGGLYRDGVTCLLKALEETHFVATTDGPMHLQGTSPDNVCNKSKLRAGIQMELSNGLRRTFFGDLRTRAGRQILKPPFYKFVEGVRKTLFAAKLT